MSKTVTCKVADMYDHTDNRDLDASIHKGFTIGKGKKLYWHFIWNGKSGLARVFPVDENGNLGYPRQIDADTTITIHFY